MTDRMKGCCLCKFENLENFFQLLCGHSICNSCSNQVLNGRIIKCPECQTSFKLETCQRFVLEMTDPKSLPKKTTLEKAECFRVQTEIEALSDMVLQIQSQNEQLEQDFQASQKMMNGIFQVFKNKIQESENLILEKLLEIKTKNQEYLSSWAAVINCFIGKRKDLMSRIDKIKERPSNVDCKINEDLMNLEKITSYELVINKFHYLGDFQSLIQKFLDECYENIKITQEKICLDLRIKEQVPLESQDYYEGEDQLIIPVDNQELRAFPIVQNQSNKANSKYFYKDQNSNKFNVENSDGDWFIEVGKDLKQLPGFVCNQINKYKLVKKVVFIVKKGANVNVADLSKMIYHTIDKQSGGYRATHNLIFIPREN